MHMLIHDTIKAQNCVISGIYGPTQNRDEDDFWKCLMDLDKVIGISWVLIRDFNELAAPQKKKGGRSIPNYKYDRIKTFTTTFNVE